MTDEDRACGYTPNPHPDCKDPKDHKNKVCDIDGLCCNGFVKEQFSVVATARGTDETVVYHADGSIVQGTVQVKNLSNATIRFFAGNDAQIVVGPFDEATISSNSLQRVRFKLESGCTAKALFCFEILLQTNHLCCCNGSGCGSQTNSASSSTSTSGVGNSSASTSVVNSCTCN